jgi:hypothetical protein
MLDVKPRPAPIISTTPEADVARSGREESSPASSIPQALTLQEAAPQADGPNSTPTIATLDTTPDADVEQSGREVSSSASSIPQALTLQEAAPQADGQYPTPMIATPDVAERAEEIGQVLVTSKSVGQASDNADGTVERLVQISLGMTVAGMLSGILLIVVRARSKRIIDHLESSLIDEQDQLEGREHDLEAALGANVMALWRPLEPKRFNVVKSFLS